MYCIGLISGTSVDGIDAALVKITGDGLNLQVDLLQGETYPYSRELRDKILAVCAGHPISMIEFAELDDAIATEFAIAAQKIQTGYPTEVIGSHGQTVFHRPPTQTMGHTLQLGRGALIAHLTGIQTISNFRVADIVAGGQGAPLVSKIDVCLLAHPTLHRCIQNIGGIGNVTYLPPRNLPHWETLAYGWDTGPGNVLMDLAIQQLTQGKQTYDADGQWARQGKPCDELVQQWLNDEYFRIPPPKSTGRELFSPSYLESCWKSAQSYHLSEADFLATLTEFTVASIVLNYRQFLPQMPDEVLLCGGGSRNSYLKERLQYRLGEKCQVLSTDDVGLNSDFKEAIAFAVLAYWRLHDFSGNLPHVTGAKQDMLLGEIHVPII